MSALPQHELSEALGEAIAGRRVVAAVFTTFTFDPGFFELEVLPVLFDRPFSHVEKVRRIQLEDALRDVEVAVVYDRAGLVPNATPASLDVRRIDVRRRTGCFHPKLVLVLVERASDANADADVQPSRALIVGALSANLTRSGWWENLEVGHFEEIRPPLRPRDACSFRRDLLALLRAIRRGAPDGDDHAALDLVEGFLTREAPRREPSHSSVRGRHHTRLFVGQEHLADWLDRLHLRRSCVHLEIVSPYYDARGASAVRRLVEALAPEEVRVLLPLAPDGSPAVTQRQYDDVARYARWARLPDALVRSGPRASAERAPLRAVHAKMIRLWTPAGGEILIAGSANATEAGCGSARGGNLEASFLVDVTDAGHGGTWLLEPLEDTPDAFAPSEVAEADAIERVGAALSLRFDWARRRLEWRLEKPYPGEIEIAALAGGTLARFDGRATAGWHDAGNEASERLEELLASTSVLAARTHPASGEAGATWRVLVREEGMAHKPSLLLSLTPEEILMYWSLLSAEQREAFLVEKLGSMAVLEGIAVGAGKRYRTESTLFDQFAGLYGSPARLVGAA